MSIEGFLNSKTVKPVTTQGTSTTPQEQSQQKGDTGSPILEVAKNLPTQIARMAVQPAEWFMKVGATIGKNLSKVAAPLLGRQYAPEREQQYVKPIVLPFQSDALLNPTSFKNTGEFIGSTAEAGLNIALALSGAGVVENVFKAGGKQIVKTAVKDAGLGAGYGIASELQNPDKTVSSVLLSGGAGAVAGAIIPPVFGKTLKLTGSLIKGGSRMLGSGLEKTATALEKKAGVIVNEVGSRYRMKLVAKETTIFSNKLANGMAETLRVVQSIPDFLQTKILNKFHPIKLFSNELNKVLGINLDHADAVQVARGLGVSKYKDMWEHVYKPMTQKYGNDWSLVKEYASYLDDLDRLANKNLITGNKSEADVRSAINSFTGHVGSKKMSVVQSGVSDLNNFYDNILKQAVQSGRLSQEQYVAMRASHPNYIPHSIIDFLSKDEGGKIASATPRPSTFNMYKSGIEKAKGSARQIEDVDISTERMLLRESILNSKNKTVSNIIDGAVSATSKSKTQYAIPLRTAENVQERISQLTELKNFIGERNNTNKLLQTVYRSEGKIQSKIISTSKELNSLADEAMTLASEMEPKSKIGSILDKVNTRERKIYSLTAELQSGENAIKKKELTTLLEDRKSSIAELRDGISELRDTQIKPVDMPEGYQKISRMKNGIREDWLMPEDVVGALRNLSPESPSTILNWVANTKLGKVVTAPARYVRSVATGVNPVFASFTNPLRDVQTTMITNPLHVNDIGQALIASIKSNLSDKEVSQIYRRALTSGAFISSIYENDLTGDVSKRIGLTFGKVIKNPLDTIQTVGKTFEESTRLAAFINGIKRGMSDIDAAKLARNATVDFSKSGEWTQVLNKFIPFLNARIQGLANMGKVLAEEPEKFVRRAMWGAAAPAAMLNAYNSKFQSYYNIPDYDRQRYWVIMAGENPGYDSTGNPVMIPHYLKIPKGEVQQAVGMIVDRVLDVGKRQFPQSTTKFMTDLIGNVSPVTGSSGWIPAGMQQIVELGFNKNLYTGSNIVPEYAKFGGKSFKTSELVPKYRYNPDTTSNVAIALGNKIGISPAQIDYILKVGVVSDLTQMSNLQYDSKKSLFENLSKMPFLRTVFGSRATGLKQDQTQFLNQLRIQYNSQVVSQFLNLMNNIE